MNEKQAKRVKVGTRVYWENDKDDQGYVVDKTNNALFIKWDMGQKGWIDNKDLEKVNKVK